MIRDKFVDLIPLVPISYEGWTQRDYESSAESEAEVVSLCQASQKVVDSPAGPSSSNQGASSVSGASTSSSNRGSLEPSRQRVWDVRSSSIHKEAHLKKGAKAHTWGETAIQSSHHLYNALLFRSGDPSPCYSMLDVIDKFSREHFRRHPVEKGIMEVYIDYADPRYKNNALWRPEFQSVFFTTYNEKEYNPLYNSLTIMAHEFGHSIVHQTSQLGAWIPFGINKKDEKIRRKTDPKFTVEKAREMRSQVQQSGALNESFADVFAILANHAGKKILANSPDADWSIGKGIYKTKDGKIDKDRAMRVIDKPAEGDMRNVILPEELLPGIQDMGGKHLYSGIPSKAFSLAAKGLQGESWETAGKIWYKALVNSGTYDDFRTFACRTLGATALLKGAFRGPTYQIVAKAWQDVGIDFRLSSTVPGAPSTPDVPIPPTAVIVNGVSRFTYATSIIASISTTALGMMVYYNYC